MYRLTLLVSAVLTVAVTAAPTDPAPAKFDKCGPPDPAAQWPNDPKDTCLAQPTLVPAGSGNGAYSIVPINVDGNSVLDYDNTACDAVIDKLCEIMSFPNVTSGKWYFQTNKVVTDDDSSACQMGFKLPSAVGAAPKPVTNAQDGNHGNQCKNILGAIRWAARGSTHGITSFKAETVNVQHLPFGVEGMWPLRVPEEDPQYWDNPVNMEGYASVGLYPSYIWQWQSNFTAPASADDGSSGTSGPPGSTTGSNSGSATGIDNGSADVSTGSSFDEPGYDDTGSEFDAVDYDA
ncbi:MAG: hypothetical protein Q9168_006627 [Polycauliona sp. 1 TL-2023]